MRTDHDREHERLLRALVTGERAAGDPELVQLLDGCARCRRAADELLGLDRALEAGGAEAAELAREAAAAPPVAGEDALLEGFRRTAAAGSARPRRRRSALAAGLAAVLLALLFAWSPWRPPDSPDANGSGGDRPGLGPGTLECLRPSGPSDDFERFEWSAPRGPQGAVELTYELRVFDRDYRPVLKKTSLQSTTWKPTPAELEDLPAEIRWEVLARDSSSAVVGSDEERAWLSSD